MIPTAVVFANLRLLLTASICLKYLLVYFATLPRHISYITDAATRGHLPGRGPLHGALNDGWNGARKDALSGGWNGALIDGRIGTRNVASKGARSDARNGGWNSARKGAWDSARNDALIHARNGWHSE